jgi:hypothetical protein
MVAAVDEGLQSVRIVQWVQADDSMLCVFTERGGVIVGVGNARLRGRVVSHIRHHADEGFSGLMVCPVDCEA